MFFRTITPAPPLSAFVACLWYSEGFEGTHAQERLLPNGESGIVIDLREDGLRGDASRGKMQRDDQIRIYDAEKTGSFDTFSPAIFCGARTDCFVIDTSEQQRVIGIQFKAGGAFPFLGMPASEVSGGTFALDDLWPGQAALLREQLLFASDVVEMFSILEQTLLARLNHDSIVHPAVTCAVRNLARASTPIRVADLAERLGFSSRRLGDLFREQTGLAPKAFQRVRRFQHVLKALRTKPLAQENWATLAAGCGYFDQAHFIHDFKSFSGMTPGEYLRVATPHLNHIPLS
jgi:AraC-like DNA-binding protein